MKTAVILLNLGGPHAEEDIRPFLKNFFMDKNIIAAPYPVRWFLSRWIAYTRGRGAARTSYAHLGGKSPLFENTQKQAKALETILGPDFRVFVSMRYWHPRASTVVRDVIEYAPEKVVLLPLYPQFSTTTTFSSFEEWKKEAARAGLAAPTSFHCCYPAEEGFIRASVQRIEKALEQAPPQTRVLFSAHGLPEKVIKGGDPYQYQCEVTAHAIAKAAHLEDWVLCYQSRVGPLKWISPSTEEALEQAAKEKRGVVIYPLAFVSEHVETLVEIDIEYRHVAKNLGIPYFGKAETVGTHPDFIQGLALKVKSADTRPGNVCPGNFRKCWSRCNGE